jgi:hypothetical protein
LKIWSVAEKSQSVWRAYHWLLLILLLARERMLNAGLFVKIVDLPMRVDERPKRICYRARMDEVRKRVIGIMASILASLHMQTADDFIRHAGGQARERTN